MVELAPVGTANESPASGPIGAFSALAVGFDRIAARPVLIIPPLLLDLLLWLGPRVGIEPFVRSVVDGLQVPNGAGPTVVQQVKSIQDLLNQAGAQFNLIRSLSTLPVGIPSLMAGLMPGSSPLAQIGPFELADPLRIMIGWGVLTLLGLAFGTWYHKALARTVASQQPLVELGRGWLRMVAVAVIGYFGLMLGVFVTLLVGLAASWVLPLLGVGLSFIAFSLLFWLVIYLIFTPHGIVRYRMGVMQAMTESVMVVRWNFLSTVAFLILAFLIAWVTSIVWSLPATGSWLATLGIIGHAFVSAMLLTSSYAFYQGRREHLVRTRQAVKDQINRLQRQMALDADFQSGKEEGEE